MEGLRIIGITQARVGSSRLPSKVLLNLEGETVLDLHLRRLIKSTKFDEVVVATTHEKGSDKICRIAERQGVKWYQGSLDDVLDRFYQVADQYMADIVVRVTSDCPLLDAEIIDQAIDLLMSGDYDYCSTGLTADFPDGLDVEVFTFLALKKAWANAVNQSEREHVTSYIWENCDFNGGTQFKAVPLKGTQNYNDVRMTVDEPEDLEVVRWLIKNLGPDRHWMDYTNYILSHQDNLPNKRIIRNEGYLKSINKDNK